MPSSPLKKTTKINVKAVTNSQKPRDIIAKAVPSLLVDKYPIHIPSINPTKAPINGRSIKGKEGK